MGRVWAGLVAVLLVATACSDDASTSTATSRPKPRAALSAATCREVDALVSANLRLFERDLFESTDAGFDRALAAKHDAIEALADQPDLTEEAHVDLTRRAVSFAVMSRLLSREYRERREQMQALGNGWLGIVMESTVASREEHDAYTAYSDGGWAEVYAIAACTAPEQLDGPVTDTSGTVEGGSVVYDAFGPADHGLRAVSSRGGPAVDVAPPAGWDDLDVPGVGPDGRTIVAIARRGEGTPSTAIAVGTLGGGFRIDDAAPSDLGCPRVPFDGSAAVVGVRYGIGPRPDVMVSVGGAGATDVPSKLDQIGCVDQAQDGTRYASQAAVGRSGWGGVWRIPAGSTGAGYEIYRDEDCNAGSGGLSPDGERLLLSQTCADLGQSGVVVMDTDSGARTTLLRRRAAIGGWSPSGEWIVFGLMPYEPDRRGDVRLWVMRRDGSGLRPLVTDEESSFPVWVSDELPAR